MNRELLILRLLQALIAIQILVGVVSIFTLSIGRAVSVFGSAAMIYLGITIVQQLVSVRELLTYSTGQQPIKKESAPTSILSQLRKNKRETSKEDNVPRTPQSENPRVYAARGQAPQGE